MADKKELLEYLRNRQKAAEIDAKVNGINLWVLLGALALISWHLLALADSPVWRERELLLRTVFATQAGYLGVWVCGLPIRKTEHIRFSSWRVRDMDTPLLDIVQGLAVVVPLVFLFLEHKDWTVIITGLFGLVFLVSGIAALARLLRGESPEGERFPKPDLAGSQRSGVIFAVLFSVGCAAALVYQAVTIERLLPNPVAESAKVLGAVAVFYALCLLTLRRRAFGESTRWTYELETDLLLDVVSADVALRRIEHRALGPRLQDVMDRFFDGLDRNLLEVERLRGECMVKLGEVSQIPEEYEAERAARARSAVAPMEQLLETAEQDCNEFEKYLKRLQENNRVGADPTLGSQMGALRARHAAYSSRLKEVRSAIQSARRATASS